jgi:predicted nucleotidyltransferase
MFPLERHTIFMTLAGSQAHGTARDGSDVDLRGVCIAPLSVRLSLFTAFEQHDGPLGGELAAWVLPRLEAHPTASRVLDIKTECVVFDIAKFVGLCAAANPNALEILFADERDWVLETPAWRRLYGERHRFLTKKVQQTFVGYALAQLKKIKTHRAWLRHPPTRKPSREDFGLPGAGGTLSRDDQNRIEQSIAEKIRSYGIDEVDMPKPTRITVHERVAAFCRDALSASEDDIEARMRAVATHASSLPSEVVATLNAEKRYRAAMKHWESYQTWKSQRNRARAALEREHGYDTKHAMHLIRLMRMGLEVLDHGELLVRRHDADELNAIRDGALSFDELLVAAERLQRDMERAAVTTALPADVDRDHVDQLAVELMTGGRGS